MIFNKIASQIGAPPSGTHLEKIRNSHNFGEYQFINQIPTHMDMDVKSGMKVMYEWLFNAKGREPSEPLPVLFGNNGQVEDDSLSVITWYGHSAVLLEIDGKVIMLDPMLGNAASPVSFISKRFAYKKPIDLSTLPGIDIVIISHDHYDHLDYSSILQLKDRVQHFYTPLGVGSHLRRWGIDEQKITELDWWETVRIDTIELIAAPARHFSGRSFTDRNKTQWSSWIIIGKNERIYFSGDSGYGPHFKEIGDRYGPFDFAMMECGQYNEKWEAIHMLPKQTIQASVDIGAQRMMPIHWGAFNLSLHTWTDPVEKALRAITNHEVIMITPQIGERFSPASTYDTTHWWEEL